jgi:NAD(P)-dependent dehydrogenase (short-subunit alcohol dehydrogenase family)
MTEPDLTGRRALVIGAGTPAGRTIALALAEAGADVAVAASSLDGEEVMACRRTRRAIEKLGRRSAEYAFDVTLGQNVQVSTRQVAKEMGGLDILVYAVWATLDRLADKITDAEWSRLVSVNFSGAFYACRAALREMLPGGNGTLLLLIPATSGVAHAPTRATSGGLAALAAGLADEFAQRGIGSYGIHVYEGEAASIDGQNAPGLPRELGALAVFLVSESGTGYNGGVYPAVLPV